MTGRRLEINVVKSAVLKITRRQGQELKIEVDKGEGKETMEEVNAYKYLANKLGNNRIFGYQMDGAVKNIKWKVASLKARAGDLADVVGVDILWKRAMRPALLYGSEIVVYSKAWVKTLAVAQIARWVTGTGPRATRIGLRVELGGGKWNVKCGKGSWDTSA